MKVLGIFGGFAFLVLLDIPLIIYKGFVFVKFWQWFVLPLGAPPISIAHGLGLMIILSLCFTSLAKKTDLEKTTDTNWFGQGLTHQVSYATAVSMIWGMGAIIHWYM